MAREEEVIRINIEEDDIAARLGEIAEKTSNLQSENQKIKKRG